MELLAFFEDAGVSGGSKGDRWRRVLLGCAQPNYDRLKVVCDFWERVVIHVVLVEIENAFDGFIEEIEGESSSDIDEVGC